MTGRIENAAASRRPSRPVPTTFNPWTSTDRLGRSALYAASVPPPTPPALDPIRKAASEILDLMARSPNSLPFPRSATSASSPIAAALIAGLSMPASPCVDRLERSLLESLASGTKPVGAFDAALGWRRYFISHDTAPRCHVTLHGAYGSRRFRDNDLATWLLDTFRQVRLSSIFHEFEDELPATNLSLYDLHHGHVFLSYPSEARPVPRLGILFHAAEYPQFDDALFPYNLGYCQCNSDLDLSLEPNVLDYRNYIWFEDSIYRLDLSPTSPLFSTLLRPEYRNVRTVMEEDFGEVVGDVYFLRDQWSRKLHHRIFADSRAPLLM